MAPSLPISKPALSAQFLTSRVLACHREPVISARGSRARATRMASATSSAARPGSFHGQFGEDGAGELVHGAAGPLAFQLARGLGELVQAEDADRVIEQAQLGAGWTRWHAATVTASRAA